MRYRLRSDGRCETGLIEGELAVRVVQQTHDLANCSRSAGHNGQWLHQ
jgi:hypothetical protein